MKVGTLILVTDWIYTYGIPPGYYIVTEIAIRNHDWFADYIVLNNKFKIITFDFEGFNGVKLKVISE